MIQVQVTSSLLKLEAVRGNDFPNLNFKLLLLMLGLESYVKCPHVLPLIYQPYLHQHASLGTHAPLLPKINSVGHVLVQ